MKKIATLLLAAHIALFAFPQSGSVGIGTTTPNSSAALDIQSTDKGVLVPRLTTAQRNAIVTPAAGLMIYQIDGNAGFHFNKGTPAAPNWQPVMGPKQAFASSMTALQSIPSSVYTQLNFNSAPNLNEGGIFDPSTNTFTAPEAGVYYIQAGVAIQNAAFGDYTLALDWNLTPSSGYTSDRQHTAGTTLLTLKVSDVVWLNAGAQVLVALLHTASTSQSTFNGSATYFKGFRIY